MEGGGTSIQDQIDDLRNDLEDGEYIPPEDVPWYSTSYQVLDDVVSISAGNYHTAAITSDGTLYTWGYNRYGQLGLGRAHRQCGRSAKGDGRG